MNASMESKASRRFGLALTLYSLVVGLAPQAIAQPVATPIVQQGTASTTFKGTVERYLLNRKGLADGLILNNGTQVKFPPHLSESLISTVKPGDQVTIASFPGISSSFGQEVHAYSITNTSSGKTLVNQPSATPPVPPTPIAANYSNLSASGTAQHWLVGRRGELKGTVLSDGTQIKFPPHVGYQLSNLAKSGARVEVQGVGTNSRYGKVLEATSLTINGQTVPLNVATPRLPPRGRRGLRLPPGVPLVGAPPASIGKPPAPVSPVVPPTTPAY